MLKISSLFVCLFTTSSVLFTSTNAINWNTGSNNVWALNCDFVGGDLSNIVESGAQCSSSCSQTPFCTHYSWTNYNGGTCWMKQDTVTLNNAIYNSATGSVCGVTIGAYTYNKGSLIWSDEFSSLNVTNQNWAQETGGNGWGNQEWEYI